MQKDLIVLFAGSVEYFRPWEKLVLGGLHRIWRRTLPMSWKVRPSFMSHIIINLNTFSYPNIGIKQQYMYFWNWFAHTRSTLIYCIQFFFIHKILVSLVRIQFFGAFFDDWKIKYNMWRKKVSIGFFIFEKYVMNSLIHKQCCFINL